MVENYGKVELYTELSTLSTKIHVDFFDLHNEIKNIGFVKLLKCIFFEEKTGKRVDIFEIKYWFESIRICQNQTKTDIIVRK